jgi:nitrogenase molybdenum-cofactor synthesis protein NifE
MIVLQPIADTAHIVHGPIACCGNSWEGRGTLTSRGSLHAMGFTTDMGEIDIVYGSEEKLLRAIITTAKNVSPKAIFVYSTCVSGLIGEDVEAICRKAERELGIKVIPVLAPGFVGPKNLGNRIAGDVLLRHVIGTSEPPVTTHYDINIIGEYNIAGDLWCVEPLLEKAGCRILSRITGDSTFEEITWAHRAKLNVVVCGRALINVAQEMEQKYGIPYVEVSFFGSTEIAKALRAIADELMKSEPKSQQSEADENFDLRTTVELVIESEEKQLKEQLKPFQHLSGKRAVLYSGGVKSWSFISALQDLGIEVVAVGTKKSTVEDERKMKELLGSDAPLVEDVAPKQLLKLLKERNADMLIAGGRNQYLAAKEGYPFVDVNQERHTAYAGYEGLKNFAEQISNSVAFYERVRGQEVGGKGEAVVKIPETRNLKLSPDILIDPLKHSASIGAAIAFQGIDGALPILHGAQGCTFLGKVLITKHYREPIALATSKLFVEDVVMGSEDRLAEAVQEIIDKNNPSIIGILTTGLTEVKGDDVQAVVARVKGQRAPHAGQAGQAGDRIIHVPTPDYEGGLETGYARAVEEVLRIAECGTPPIKAISGKLRADARQINVLVGSHLTPADVNELREIIESFGLEPIILPDLSALDGSRQHFGPLASGGTTADEIKAMGNSQITLALGISMEPGAKLLQQTCGVAYKVFESIAGLSDTDALLETLSQVSKRPVPKKYERARQALIDTMRDAHMYYGNKNACVALEPDFAVQTSKWLTEMGMRIELAVIPTLSDAADRICAEDTRISGLFSISGAFDLLISNSHGELTATKLGSAFYPMGFPVYKTLGYTSKVMIGYQGTQTMVHEVANLLMKKSA